MKTFDEVRKFVTALLQEREETLELVVEYSKYRDTSIIEVYRPIPAKYKPGANIRFTILRVFYQSGENDTTGFFYAESYHKSNIILSDAINLFIHS